MERIKNPNAQKIDSKTLLKAINKPTLIDIIWSFLFPSSKPSTSMAIENLPNIDSFPIVPTQQEIDWLSKISTLTGQLIPDNRQNFLVKAHKEAHIACLDEGVQIGDRILIVGAEKILFSYKWTSNTPICVMRRVTALGRNGITDILDSGTTARGLYKIKKIRCFQIGSTISPTGICGKRLHKLRSNQKLEMTTFQCPLQPINIKGNQNLHRFLSASNNEALISFHTTDGSIYVSNLDAIFLMAEITEQLKRKGEMLICII